jgi:hypothetical protein
MRKLVVLFALLAFSPLAHAQWNIFAEKLPAPGSWAKYEIARMDTTPPEKPASLRLSVQAAGDVKGKLHVWLTIEPVAWLGSREKGPLRFLVPADIDREGANRLLYIAAEILFVDPAKGPWHMLPDDVSSLAGTAGYETISAVTPESTTPEKIQADKNSLACLRYKMTATTVINPPFVKKQVITLAGHVWRNEEIPFGVVRAEWTETTVKGSKTRSEEKRLVLQDYGHEEVAQKPTDHGERFSIFRLLFNR